MSTTPDERITILRQLTSENLGALIGEIASDQFGISALFFSVGMAIEFRKTQPEELVDLCASVIKERIEAKRASEK